MTSTDTSLNLSDDDFRLAFDRLDERTAHQQALQDALADGFLALARERYANPISQHRLGKLVYDAREGLKAGVLLEVRKDEQGKVEFEECDENDARVQQDTGMRRRGGGEKIMGKKDSDVTNSFVGMPSTEIRKVISCFRKAIKEAVEVANAAERIEQVINKDRKVDF